METANGITLLKFHAPWCSPCKVMAATLAQIISKFPGISVKSVDIDNDPTQAADYDVRAIPTLILLKNGAQAGRLVGAHSEKEIESFLSGA